MQAASRPSERLQTACQSRSQLFDQPFVALSVYLLLNPEHIQLGHRRRQAAGQGFCKARTHRRFAEYAAGAGLLQALAHGGNVTRPRLHFAAGSENAAMAEAVGSLEVVVGLVEDEEGLVLHIGKTLAEALVQRLDTLGESPAVGLIAFGVGRVGGSEVGGHALGDHPRIGRQQPEMGIKAAGAVVVIMIVMLMLMLMLMLMFMIVGMILAEMSQRQPWQFLHGHARALAPIQRAWKEI